MSRKRRLAPDTRPNWRDPNMPVSILTFRDSYVLISPEDVQADCQITMENFAKYPEWFGDKYWRNDPINPLKKL